MIIACISSITICLVVEYCRQTMEDIRYRRRFRARVQNHYLNLYNRMFPTHIIELDLEKGINQRHQDVLLKVSDLDNISMNSDVKCAICLESILPDEKICVLECKHMYHQDCISSWVNTKLKENKETTCPICRFEIYNLQIE